VGVLLGYSEALMITYWKLQSVPNGRGFVWQRSGKEGEMKFHRRGSLTRSFENRTFVMHGDW